MALRGIQEGQKFFQVFFETGHGSGCLPLPAALPLTERGDRFGSIGRLVDEFGLVQAGALRGFEFILQVAQLVRPAARGLAGGAGSVQNRCENAHG